MTTIDVDFDVFKELTRRRAAETVTYNDVIRDALGLSKPPNKVVERTQRGASFKGVFFPDGTMFRGTYKGRAYTAEIKDGHFWRPDVNRIQSSPSQAAVSITGKNWNGWQFWECKRPGDPSWQLMSKLRPKLTIDDI